MNGDSASDMDTCSESESSESDSDVTDSDCTEGITASTSPLRMSFSTT